MLRLLANRKAASDGRIHGAPSPELSKLSNTVDGIILDSAPAYITPDIAARCEDTSILAMMTLQC